jgi:anti-sigma B factor antagonist
MQDDTVAAFRARAERRGEVVVIVAHGELDLTGAPVLAEAVPDGDEPLVVDLESVGFMDSSGLRALLEARQRCLESGRPFALARPSEAVRRVLELVDLEREFELLEAPPA